MTDQEIRQEISHIFESGANEVRVFELVKRVLKKYGDKSFCKEWIHKERVKMNDDIYCPICGKQLQGL